MRIIKKIKSNFYSKLCIVFQSWSLFLRFKINLKFLCQISEKKMKLWVVILYVPWKYVNRNIFYPGEFRSLIIWNSDHCDFTKKKKKDEETKEVKVFKSLCLCENYNCSFLDSEVMLFMQFFYTILPKYFQIVFSNIFYNNFKRILWVL